MTWIDVTDLALWQAHMTGIQRVVYNIGKLFAADGSTRFFIYDPERGVIEVDFDEVTRDIGPRDDEPESPPPAPVPPSLVRRTVRFGIRAVKGVARRVVPMRLRVARHERRVHAAEHHAELVARARVVVPAPEPVHPFAPGDVIVVLGASWKVEGQFEYLAAIRQRIGIRLVHSVYDLIPIRQPQFFGPGFGQFFLRHMFDVMAQSDHLLAISQNTRRDTVDFQRGMRLPEVPVSVFRLGDNPTHHQARESPDPLIVAGEYVLAVGTLEVRKNYIALYNAWSIAADEGVAMPKLVIVGQGGWLANEVIFLFRNDPRAIGNIILRTKSDDAELAWLYANCILTVYPSLYEGWGLPIAESLHYGKLCIASNTSSMPEIAGELIEYCDPYDPRQFLGTIRRFVEDRELLARAERRIAEEYRPHTWEEGVGDIVASLATLKATDS